MASKLIKQNQIAWAASVPLVVDDDGYCRTLDDNLFRPLSPSTRAEFLAGDGAELGEEGRRGKAQALHSSSMLACNFFDYWRGGDLSILAKVFRTGDLADLRFEEKFPTGLRGNSPNLDVVLRERDGGIVAIESKFTEPFAASKRNNVLKDAYFNAPDTWSSKGLPGCQRVAEQLRADPGLFKVLDAAQLLKHMLGLACSGRVWRLCCLWYRVDGEMGDLHAAELEAFRERIGDDSSRFTSRTYQEVFAQMKDTCPPGHDEYLTYLERRYFPSN